MTHTSALITGSTSGIGRATAALLAERGAHVVISGRHTGRGGQVVAEIRASGGSADFVRAELSDAASATRLAEEATKLADAAGHTLDILVNNAGAGYGGPTEETAEQDFDAVFATNLKVPFYLVAALAPAMATRGKGAIVNVSTLASRRALPGLGVYGASKAGLNQLTRSWASEYGPSGVRVNAVSPGPTRTPGAEQGLGEALDLLGSQTPLGHVAEPRDVAATIAYLIGPDAQYVNGVILDVDGGHMAI
ncbi:SDR family NAD(P)-dependent oxidoreductase [Streptomyces phaeochromogenes]|uniref:SDR family NAD(P)-dependent oxidoreductase n=1 Tax=Streptomyces phaeochromogenes TaxID=1923 RepID=UPI00386FCFA7|nr:SDR family oxidoreductase [Streptomyces phaeochromogenes]WSW11688.1 SDR family oxidoreductase [Streptomyces phaeochromogenes]